MDIKYPKISSLSVLLFVVTLLLGSKPAFTAVPHFVVPDYRLDKVVELNTHWRFYWQKMYQEIGRAHV